MFSPYLVNNFLDSVLAGVSGADNVNPERELLDYVVYEIDAWH
jgi:hypothetical protein